MNQKVTRKNFLKNAGIAGLGILTIPNLLSKTAQTTQAKPFASFLFEDDSSCILAPNQTGGPFYVAPEFDRQDISEGIAGHPFHLDITLVDVNTCEPIPNALFNLWHNNADGAYSQFGAVAGNPFDASDETWLRGYQITNCDGKCSFDSIFPGWYPGRVTHLHFDVHINGASTKVSQMYFNDTIDNDVYENIEPYSFRTDGVGGGPTNPSSNSNEFVASNAEANGVLVVSAEELEYDVAGNPLPVVGCITIAIDMTGLTTDDANCAGVPVELKAFLEGPYAADGMMNAALADLIPLTQPYSGAPYSYAGSETLSAVPTDMVDWVLVEARTGTPNVSGAPGTTVIETQAGILLTDGSIVQADGSQLRFSLNVGDLIYFAVRHRNHLDVLSATAGQVPASGGLAFDFTTNTSQAWGTLQQKESADGKAMLFAGDFNADQVIQTTDYDQWTQSPAVLDSYEQVDANLDGVVQVTDYDQWFENKAKLGSSELEF